VVSQKNLGFWYTVCKGKKLRKSKEKLKYRESKNMSKKNIFLSIFSKITIFACVFCTFFASPVFATLPAGYTELEYIESTGTQYIDTGYIFTSENEKITADFQVTDLTHGEQDKFLLGTQSADTSKGMIWVDLFRYTGSTTIGNWYVRFGSSSSAAGFVGNENTRYQIELSKNTFKLYSGETLIGSLSPNWIGTFQNTPLTVFGRLSNVGEFGESTPAKFWSLKIQNGDTLTLDLIPAKRLSDNAIGMFDTVSQTFFTNAGTGDFIAGPEVVIKIATTKMVNEEFAAAEAKLATTVQTIESVVSRTISQTEQIQILQDTKQTRPNETCPANMKCLLVQDEDGTPHWYPIIEPKLVSDSYTQLEYIEGTGTQYIDTGIANNSLTNPTIEITLKMIDKADVFWFGVSTYIAKGISYNMKTVDSDHRWFARWGSSSFSERPLTYQSGKSADDLVFTDALHTLKLTGTKNLSVYVDGELVGTNTYNSCEFTATESIQLFGISSPSTRRKMQLGMWAISDNGVLLQKLIPAKRNSDNVIGMYDTVTGQFFTNAGTGTFVAGPTVF
ncbi:MAG: hypothetical protein MJ164_02270, partial [Alphaproteobacteria bacterium]|nr:hypothetical protein [Alphaproteobacteria bacterium]